MSVKNNEYGIAELQDKMLDILKHFITVCEKNKLQYWLAAGTCLGAIRHGGFIPWDDDLDVYMMREDYEKLWELEGNAVFDGHYKLCRTSKEKNYHHRVMQIVDLNTTFIHSRSKDEDLEHGVYIDIMPLDACPESRIQRFLQIVNAVFFSVFNIQCKPEYNGGKATGIISAGTVFLLSIVKSPTARYKAWKCAEARMTRYPIQKCTHVKCITSLFRELFRPFPKEWFGERKVPFEDIMAVVPSNAEAYCEATYGDYMKLPPAEKRTVRHHTEFIDLNSSYLKYKGIYYLTDQNRRKGSI